VEKRSFTDNFLNSYFRVLFVLASFVSVFIAVIIYINSINRSEVVFKREMLNRQVVSVRSAAKVIEEFFKAQEQKIAFIASIPEIKNPDDPNIANILTDAQKSLPIPISDIVRFDANGDSVARGSGITQVDNVSDREYFLWAKDPKNKGSIFYSNPLIARGGSEKGKLAMAIVTPVYSGNKFTGVLLMTVSFDNFGQLFITDLKITNGSRSFVVNLQDGSFIFPAINSWKDSADFSKNLSSMAKEQEGVGIFLNNLIAYHIISLGDGSQFWSLVMVISENETLSLFKSVNLNFINFLILVIVIILTLLAILILAIRFGQRNSYLRGFVDGQNYRKAK